MLLLKWIRLAGTTAGEFIQKPFRCSGRDPAIISKQAKKTSCPEDDLVLTGFDRGLWVLKQRRLSCFEVYSTACMVDMMVASTGCQFQPTAS